ncbi:MAG: hypothetical protein ACUVV6_07550 [Thermoplasmatota archaeon]
MARTVIGVKMELASKVPELLKDDLVSRQSITTREGQALGIKLDLYLVFIEGSEAAVARAIEVFKGVGDPLPEKEAAEAFAKVKEEEERASVGMGMIFEG